MQTTQGCRRRLMFPEAIVVLAMLALIAIFAIAFAGLFQLAYSQ